jgi:RNA polymerase sigma-70 factor (ECF subfamily)
MTSAAREATAQSAGEDAFTGVFREHAPFVFRALLAFGVADHAVDDAVQEVFLVLHRRWQDRPADGALRSWLFAIARRVAGHHRRALSRWIRKLSALPTAHAAASLAGQAEARAELAELQQSLDMLPERQRLAFFLVDIEQMPAVEAARALDVNINSFHSRLSAARRALALGREHADAPGTLERRHHHG